MGVVDKTTDTVGGAVKGGLKGILIGAAITIAAPALILGAVGLLGGAGWALGLGAVGAALGMAASISGATLGGAIGALGGGAKGLVKDRGEAEPTIDQQLSAARARNADLNTQLAKRQEAASGFENPDANGGFVAKTQTTTQQTTAAQRA